MTEEEMRAQIEQLKAENADLKAKKQAPPKVSFKVGAKKGMSMYGLGRFPVTLYKSQWNRLLEHAEQIRAALGKFDAELADKE